MEELIKHVEKSIHILKLNIERNKKYFDYPFTSNCEHFYRLNQMHKQLECWNHFLETLKKYKNDRCGPLSKESSIFEKKIDVEKRAVPGFVTHATMQEMLEYMRKLEWKVDELNGIWREGEVI